MQKYTRAIAFALVAGATVLGTTACSVARDQQTVGSYVDDAGITTAVKAKMAEDKSVSATSISVYCGAAPTCMATSFAIQSRSMATVDTLR